MKLTICPSCIEKADSTCYSAALMYISNPNTPYKLLVDRDNILFDTYKKAALSTSNDYMSTMLSLLADHYHIKVKKVPITHTPTDNLNINILANAYTGAQKVLLAADDSLLEEHALKIDEYNIEIKDKSETLELIKGHNDTSPPCILSKLIDKLCAMMKKKTSIKLEDFHNDELSVALENFNFGVDEQARAGITKSRKNPGSLDILIKATKTNRPLAIVEALRESSCGDKNTNIADHLDKLLNDYDFVGLEINYLITYCEAANFGNFWDNYVSYMENINEHSNFRGSIPQISFVDTGKDISNYTDLRIGRGIYSRSGRDIQVYHIVCNMHVPQPD